LKKTREDLDRSLVHGIAWTSAMTWFSQLLSWVATFYVASRLETADYGLVGTAAIYIGVVAMISEFGLGSAVVRFQSLTRDTIGQFNSLSVMLGVTAMLISWAVAVPVGKFLEEPHLPQVMVVMSAAFLISSFRVVPQAVMQREMRFRRLAIMEGTQSLCMATANITFATLGFGYWTLALGPLTGSTVFMILVLIANPLPFRRPRMDSIREPFEYSRQTILTRFAWFGYSNADFFIVSKVLGRHAMGTYVMGWTIAGMGVEKITALIWRVTPAFFASIQEDLAEVRRYLVIITEGLALLTFPVCVGLALVADELMLAIGPQWESAAFPLRVLALLAIPRSIDPLVQQVLSAIGEAKMNLENGIVTVCVLPPAFFFAAGGWGISGVAVAWLILGPLLFGRLLRKALRRIDMPARAYFGALWPAISGCLIMAVAVMAVNRWGVAGMSLHTSLAVQVATGALTYAGTLLLLHRDRVMRLRTIIAVLRSRKPAVETVAAVAPPTA
jgi:PST family polysaccharide transporter